MVNRYNLVLAAFVILTSFTTQASATSLMGGSGNVYAGSGVCPDSFTTPLNTPQDTYTQSATTACSGDSGSVALTGDAATATISNLANALGNGFGSSFAGGQINFTDTWTVSAPDGTPFNSFISIPVQLSVEGSVSSGAVAYYNSDFLSYNLKISDKYNPLLPGSNFVKLGTITTTGSFLMTFSGIINLFYDGSIALPIEALVEMTLFSSIYEGDVDIKSSVKLTLLDGFTAKTSSGLPLAFDASEPPTVPVPAALPLLASGIAGLGLMARRRRNEQKAGLAE